MRKMVLRNQPHASRYWCNRCGWHFPAVTIGTAEEILRCKDAADRDFQRHNCLEFPRPFGEPSPALNGAN